MNSDRFLLGRHEGYVYELVREGNDFTLTRSAEGSAQEVVATLSRERVRDMVFWMASEGRVTTVFEGPMANEIRKASRELGLSEQMVIWNAVKLFLDIGAEGR